MLFILRIIVSFSGFSPPPIYTPFLMVVVRCDTQAWQGEGHSLRSRAWKHISTGGDVVRRAAWCPVCMWRHSVQRPAEHHRSWPSIVR